MILKYCKALPRKKLHSENTTIKKRKRQKQIHTILRVDKFIIHMTAPAEKVKNISAILPPSGQIPPWHHSAWPCLLRVSVRRILNMLYSVIILAHKSSSQIRIIRIQMNHLDHNGKLVKNRWLIFISSVSHGFVAWNAKCPPDFKALLFNLAKNSLRTLSLWYISAGFTVAK